MATADDLKVRVEIYLQVNTTASVMLETVLEYDRASDEEDISRKEDIFKADSLLQDYLSKEVFQVNATHPVVVRVCQWMDEVLEELSSSKLSQLNEAKCEVILQAIGQVLAMEGVALEELVNQAEAQAEIEEQNQGRAAALHQENDLVKDLFHA